MGDLSRDSACLTILYSSGPVGLCSDNRAEMQVMGLSEAHSLNLSHILVEREFIMCHQGGLGSFKAPWAFADVVEEVQDLSKERVVSFTHVKRSANSVAEVLAKEGVSRPNFLFLLMVCLNQ